MKETVDVGKASYGAEEHKTNYNAEGKDDFGRMKNHHMKQKDIVIKLEEKRAFEDL